MANVKETVEKETSGKRLAIIAIVVENPDIVADLNALLHEYSACIIGRMGIPCPSRNVSLISIAVDAPSDLISAMTGKIGRHSGPTVKTAYSKT